jgi:adenylyltransferase/sulfurtransferase
VHKPIFDERGLPPEYEFDDEWEITPREVKRKLDKKENFVFIDCRNPNEEGITKIDGGKLIPLPTLGARIGELRGKEQDEVIVYCRSGGRSLQFAQILKQQGFKNVKSMAGGVLLWNQDVNPGGPQY